MNPATNTLSRRGLTFALAGALLAAIALFFAAPPSASSDYAICNSDGGPGVVTDRIEYLGGETAAIRGCGLDAYVGQNLTLRIIHPDAAVDTDTVVPDVDGKFTYDYVVPAKEGEFLVDVLDGIMVLASASFFDNYYVTPENLVFVAIQGADPASQTFDFVGPTSCSNGTVADSQSWISTTPSGSYTNSQYVAGPGSGVEHLTVTVNIDSDAKPLGTYTGTVTVDATGSNCGDPRTVSITLHVIKANPPLTQACGLDMVLVIDSSGSIDSTELSQMKSAFNNFVSAFLPDTPTEIAVVEFDDSATVRQGFTTNTTLLNTAINNSASGGYTNWDDALYDSRNLFPNRVDKPDLIVFASDGNPTARYGHLSQSVQTNVSSSLALPPAIDEGNSAKTSGIRILTLGIGDELTTSSLAAISSPDAVTTSNFSTLASDLSNLAKQLCGGTITVQKIIDLDGNTATTGDQTNAPGWTFTTNVDSPDSSTPASGPTDANGMINFAINLGANQSAVVDITETTQSGYNLVSKSCKEGANPVGTPSGNAVNNITVTTLDIINCKFYNQPVATFTVQKDFSPNNAASVTVTLSCTSGTVTPASASASEATPASFTVTGYTGNPTCTATESPIPTGYQSTGTCAATKSVGTCIILNTLRTATLNVLKDFVPNAGGTVTVGITCSSGTVTNTDTSASEADDANFTITGFNTGATCTASEGTAPAGYTKNESGCASVVITHTGTTNCTIINTQNTANFNVIKDFSPNNAASVTVGLTCSTGTVTNTDTSASEADDANFTVTGFTTPATCTATEGTAPAGYTSNEAACANVAISVGGTASCTIVNTLNSATFTVNKDFSDNNAATVSVTLSCGAGTIVAPNPKNATEAAPAVFTVTGITTSTTCTASEGTAPAGYTASGCTTPVTLNANGTASCTITNTLNTANFNVLKDFVPNAGGTVTVALTCTSGTVVNTDTSASEADDANFTVNGFSAGATCTANEGTAPSGYTKNEAACTTVAISAGGTASCTITNTLNSATFTVNKDFSDNSAATVSVTLSCGAGTIVAPNPKNATEAAPAVFTVTGLAANTTCTASEGTAPAGYTASGCTTPVTLTPTGTASCTITNTLNTANFNVSKDFSDNNSANVTVGLTCSTGTVTNVDVTASESDAANFTVAGFTVPANCTATEGTAPAGYTKNEAGCVAVSITVGGTASCTIINNLNSATFTVNKDFSDNSAATVSVTLSCGAGTIVAPNPKNATEAAPAVFSVTGLAANTTCTASEGTAPAGYTASGCTTPVTLTPTGTASCTITNTLNTANFNVSKDFSDNNSANVTVGLTCSTGTVTNVDVTASESDAANFTVAGFTVPANCTATEGTAPAGYTKNEAACAAVSITVGGTASCTIINNLNSATFTVNKDFSDNNAATVSVTLSCGAGTIVAPNPKNATEAAPAVFTVTGITTSTTCTASEGTAPAGYTASGCTTPVTLNANGTASCTITNTLNTANFNVLKDFVPNAGGTVTAALTCTSGTVVNTDTSASEADDANFTVNGFNAGATCTANEGTAPAGYTKNETACTSVAISIGGTANCTIVNTQNTANFNVIKDFSPNNAASVTIGLTCSTGTVTNTDTSASEADDANFTVTGFTTPATCTATEGTAPAGYTSNEAACANVSISVGGTASCTIVNTLNSATFTVNKDFSDNNAATVSVTLSCGAGTIVAPNPKNATEAAPAVFTVTGITTSTTCTASEGTAPAGYTASGCTTPVTLNANGTASCTITNTLNTANFNVTKDFSDNSAGSVTVGLTCSTGTVTNTDTSASEADDANFSVSGFTAPATCTATEGTAPTGYTKNEAACATVAITVGGTASCTIVNTLNSATFTVNKDFSDNSAATVSVTLSCGAGTIVAPNPKNATEAAPAVFSVTGLAANTTCTASEGTAPAGYTASGCTTPVTLTPTGTASCTITNTLNTANFNVSKDFSDNNSANVTVGLTCSTGTVTNVDVTASESDAANFTVAGFTVPANCTATEGTAPAGYTKNEAGCVAVSITVGGTASCTIINNLNSATFTVNKDFSDNSAATVSVTLSCGAGTIVAPNPKNATEAAPAVFSVTGLAANTTCTASEGTAPAGYTASGCTTPVTLTPTGTASCTITNTLNTANFNVTKDFSDNSAASVTVGLTCSTGTVTNVDTSASEADDANFTVSGFTVPATCTATEGAAPAGYTKNETACAAVTITVGGTATCQIVNTLNGANFNVNKDFIPNAGGTVTVGLTCTNGGVVTNVDTSASEADDANFTVSGFTAGATCTATEGAAPTGYDKNEAGCVTVAISVGGTASCTIINTLRTAQVVVAKDFSDNNTADVTVGVTCTSGSVANDDTTASESDPANFTVTGFNLGATCTATEGVPAGYTANQAPCASVAITPGGTTNCTITNTLNTANFNVIKDFSDNSAGSVTVGLTCSTGTVTNTDTSASEADDANFTVSGFTVPANCTATEGTAPAGYTKNEAACLNVAITVGGTASCTIVNTLNSATFNVTKDFSDNSAASVTVGLTCTNGGVVTNVDTSASEADDANFTVAGFTAGATCTATEGPAPTGYTKNESACVTVAISVGGTSSCQIVNTLNTATFNVTKDFSDNSAASVTVGLTCSTGTVTNTDTSASEADDANFTVSGFTAPATCTATEGTAPAGYTKNETACLNVAITVGGTSSCQIVNTLNGANFNVTKDFSDNSAASVTVGLTCTNGGIVTNVDTSASEADDANFTVSGFTAGATCTATEGGAPTGYTKNETACVTVAISVGGTATCQIVNTLNTANFNVTKDFSDNSAASVTVGLTCSTGTVTNTDTSASEADDANFTVSGFTTPATCSATEGTAPAGYTKNESACVNVAISVGGTSSCQIVNTLNTATFHVDKDFSDNGPGTVTIALTCSTGTVVNTDVTATESDDADFTVNGFTTPATCSATEGSAPAGYTKDESACQNVAITVGGTSSCIIYNSKLGKIIVQKTTIPGGDPQSFTVNLGGAGSGSVSVTDAVDASFDNLAIGTYSLTEVLPAGWQANGGTCSDGSTLASIGISEGETVTCTLTNTKLGTIIVQKTTHPSGSAQTFPVSLTGPTAGSGSIDDAADQFFTNRVPGSYTLSETVPGGWQFNSIVCVGGSPVYGTATVDLTLAAGQTITCTFDNSTVDTFTVSKDFNPNYAGSVQATLSCASGTVTPAGAQTLAEGSPVVFTVTGFSGDPMCTANESSVPGGYVTSSCQAALSVGACTIVNVLTGASFTVHKDFSDNNPAGVTVSVSCASGTASPASASVTESTPVTFNISGYTGDPTCTATESPIPTGYESTGTCAAALSATQCTITNTLRSANFNVIKDFSDNSAGSVTVGLTCSTGTVANTDTSASEADDANFTVTGFTPPATCSATEGTAPTGYTKNESACQNVAISHLGTASCTIVNTLNTATVNVLKDFSDNNPADVTIALNCGGPGAVANTDTTASESDDANFTVTGFNPGDTCVATEGIPAGYEANITGCAALTLSAGGTVSCTITNTLRTATLNVLKDFVPNAGGTVTISVNCTSGSVANTDTSASEADDANFTITGFNVGATCTATEGIPGGYSANQTNCAGVAIINGGTASCTIVNTSSGTFQVMKDFVPNVATSVTVSLSCASGTASPASASASEGSPATFTVTGYTGNPNCTATETPVPGGYTSTGTCSALLNAGSCTIVNTLITPSPTPSPTPVPATATPTPTPTPPPTASPTVSPVVSGASTAPATPPPSGGPVGGIVDLPVMGTGAQSDSTGTGGTSFMALLLTLLGMAALGSSTVAYVVVRRR